MIVRSKWEYFDDLGHLKYLLDLTNTDKCAICALYIATMHVMRHTSRNGGTHSEVVGEANTPLMQRSSFRHALTLCCGLFDKWNIQAFILTLETWKALHSDRRMSSFIATALVKECYNERRDL